MDGTDGHGGSSPEGFERTGYEPLTFPRPRRDLLPAAVEWFRARSGSTDASPTFRLSELGTMPDDELADMTPSIAPGCGISVRDGAIWGRPPGAASAVRLLGTSAPDLCAFNAMNGAMTIAEIAGAVADETGWPPERAFAFTRGLFLHLVRLRVCIPAECDGR